MRKVCEEVSHAREAEMGAEIQQSEEPQGPSLQVQELTSLASLLAARLTNSISEHHIVEDGAGPSELRIRHSF